MLCCVTLSDPSVSWRCVEEARYSAGGLFHGWYGSHRSDQHSDYYGRDVEVPEKAPLPRPALVRHPVDEGINREHERENSSPACTVDHTFCSLIPTWYHACNTHPHTPLSTHALFSKNEPFPTQ